MLTKLRSDYPAALKKNSRAPLVGFLGVGLSPSVDEGRGAADGRTDGLSDCGEPRARESPLLLRSMRRRRRKERTPKNARCNAPNKTERKAQGRAQMHLYGLIGNVEALQVAGDWQNFDLTATVEHDAYCGSRIQRSCKFVFL